MGRRSDDVTLACCPPSRDAGHVAMQGLESRLVTKEKVGGHDNLYSPIPTSASFPININQLCNLVRTMKEDNFAAIKKQFKVRSGIFTSLY